MTAEELRKLAESVSIPHMSVDRATILALVSELEALRDANAALMTERTSIIETKRTQIEALTASLVVARAHLAALTKENFHV